MAPTRVLYISGSIGLIHPTTRHSLREMTLGSVREDWARHHHAKWRSPGEESPLAEPRGGSPSGR